MVREGAGSSGTWRPGTGGRGRPRGVSPRAPGYPRGGGQGRDPGASWRVRQGVWLGDGARADSPRASRARFSSEERPRRRQRAHQQQRDRRRLRGGDGVISDSVSGTTSSIRAGGLDRERDRVRARSRPAPGSSKGPRQRRLLIARLGGQGRSSRLAQKNRGRRRRPLRQSDLATGGRARSSARTASRSGKRRDLARVRRQIGRLRRHTPGARHRLRQPDPHRTCRLINRP